MASKKSREQLKLIDELGGPVAVRDVLKKRIGKDAPRSPQAVSMWKARGKIPFEYRAALAIEARERNIGVPAGFLGEGVVTTAEARA